ncbi:hypothetical protein [Pelodictyon phaeoclathratiforme]|jgi:hypothetical protein|uniref:Uncharacterized protein n=1 Tax=Pelodictyon phaeoclathratiforme (strain DSM 5477 / BU-1) TaxID=324925 RepID=B4SFV7_PELPB|nr:hypothetical protein [Pelodictyon phaeoclathratiforme]ACF44784.1 hypothetical protein Ppha_2623 [Pelodictyon phaeoclathratiforme BU-1]MBV5289797.1 hypothetical protein [Pelodictyon phaeoclathratiforme]
MLTNTLGYPRIGASRGMIFMFGAFPERYALLGWQLSFCVQMALSR